MRVSRQLTTLLLLVLWAAATPAGAREAPKPAANDFLLRVAKNEVDDILARHGLELVQTVKTAPDAAGRNLYLVRAPQGYDPKALLEEVQAQTPDPVWIEEAFLASLPETYPGLVLEQRTRAILGAVQQVTRLQPPGGTFDSGWIASEVDRWIASGTTGQLEITFQNTAQTAVASYGLKLGFAEGITRQFDPATAACGAAGHGYLVLPSDKPHVRWKLVNTGAAPITLASLSLTWPTGNGDLRRIWLDGGATEIFSGSLKAPAASISSGWKVDSSKLQVAPGQTQELVFEFRKMPSTQPGEYAITAEFTQGCRALFLAGGEVHSAAIHPVLDVGSQTVRWKITNLGAQPLTLASVTPTWPQENGRMTALRLAGKDLIDAVVEVPFGTNPDGSPRKVWRAYVEQPAAAQLRVDEAAKDYQGEGAVIAVIDSGVDPDHPLLRDVLLPGFDFVHNVYGTASEWSDLDQRTRAILGQRTMAILGGDDVVPLNPSTSAVLDGVTREQLDPTQLPPGFGHGTMVAGVIHRVAPKARILPLKAFSASGQGHVFDVVRAIYYAVDQGVTAINMSFSLEAFSPELMRAVNYAAGQGIACISSAGNDGREVIVFPASLGNSIGVASTSADGRLSRFSNFGGDLVTIAAPGEDVVTSYPGGGWALASGTSFAAPWISGAAALFADKNDRENEKEPDRADYYLATEALSHALPVVDLPVGAAGFGRADLAEAVGRLKSGLIYDLWPRADYSVVVRLAGGCTVEYPPVPGESGCGVRIASQLELKDSKMFWQFTNTGTQPVTLQGITLHWPEGNGRLKEIQLNGNTIFKGYQAGPSCTIDFTSKKLQIAPGGTGILRFDFEITALPS